MSQMSDFLEKQLASHIFGSGTYTKPSVIAIALCSGAPVDANTGANIPEIANANAYARQTLNPSAANWLDPVAVDGITNNIPTITFPTCTTAAWGLVSGVAILDDATYGAGNMLTYGTLSVGKTVGVGDTLSFASGNITVTFA